MIANKACVRESGALFHSPLFSFEQAAVANLKTPHQLVRSRPNFNRKMQTVAALAVAMIFDESEQEWVDRVSTPVVTIAATLLIGLFCYFLLILFMPLIFGHQTAAL